MIEKSIPNFGTEIVLTNFIKQHAQEMEEHVMQQHIQLYVNKYSLHIGNDGLQAIQQMQSILNKI